MVDPAENYYHEENPELKALLEEEDEILARAKEINERRRLEKEEFESGYKPKLNPVTKILKWVSRLAW